MDMARYFITNTTSSWLVTFLLLIGGLIAFFNIGKLEDPQYTIKQAVVAVPYPGASPEQVEEEVTLVLEQAIQRLPYLDDVETISTAGLSIVTVNINTKYRSEQIPQIWDELRRRVNDATFDFPPGALTPMVSDDFGDVFGILLTITGDGYTKADLEDFADILKREFVIVDGVGKVQVQGVRNEIIVVEVSRSKMTSIGISPNQLLSILDTKNLLSYAGRVGVGEERLRFVPTGGLQSLDELEQLLISNPFSDDVIFLGDIATIYRDYEPVPESIIRFNGKSSLLMGISFAPGVNVVDVGDAVQGKLMDMEKITPAGMDINYAYNQPREVTKSVDGFLVNLAAAVGIVVLVLFFSMGWRSGLIIGVVLGITVMGTFIFMLQMGIQLQRVSLGALVIALGMLVDNAIVVTEGILTGIKRRMSLVDAASLTVKQTKWPLLGATIIAVTAFAPIGLSPDDTGEFAGSLFWVLMVSLLLSWATGITITPFFASLLLKDSSPESKDTEKPENNKLGFFATILGVVLRYRTAAYLCVGLAFVLSVYGFGHVKQVFFPPATTPIFTMDVWTKNGTDIFQTDSVLQSIESDVMSIESVEQVTTSVGGGTLRFMLTYQPEYDYAEYAQLMVRLNSLETMNSVIGDIQQTMQQDYPEHFFKIRRLEVGPSTKAKIEARFSGPDPEVLSGLAERAKLIMSSDDGAANIRDNWGTKSKVIEPILNESAARRVGINNYDIDELLAINFEGQEVGVYRDGSDILPIIVRAPEDERLDAGNLNNLQVYSPSTQQYLPISQVVDEFAIKWEYPYIHRKDRKRTITVMADPEPLGDDTTTDVFMRIRGDIDAMVLPDGYELEWGGDFEASTDAEAALFMSLPLGLVVMLVITILLFNSARAALAIWMSVPCALIGVTVGMLVGNFTFGFMALLGLLSLSGMMIKNGIVLVEQINIEKATGKAPFLSVVDAAISRVRPVSMAALTTILGLIPLLTDNFFSSMAIVIMSGLAAATFLTLVFVPLFYCTVFSIKTPQGE